MSRTLWPAGMVPIALSGLAIALWWCFHRVNLRLVHLAVLGEGAAQRRRRSSAVSAKVGAVGRHSAGGAAFVLGASIGWIVGGPVPAAVGGIAAAIGVRVAGRQKGRIDVRALDQQVSELAEGIASGVRGGLSIAQAVEFAASDTQPPMTAPVQEFLTARGVGVPFQTALSRLAGRVGTDEMQLLALVLGIHHRSGGNVAGALDDVAATIRHRVRLRGELRALTAQGRISGTVLGVLPIGFFLVMALTSRGQFEPVLRSLPGAMMVSVGFLLEGLAFLWIRRLLRVDA